MGWKMWLISGGLLLGLLAALIYFAIKLSKLNKENFRIFDFMAPLSSELYFEDGASHYPYKEPLYVGFDNPYIPEKVPCGMFRGNTGVFPLMSKDYIHENPWKNVGELVFLLDPSVSFPIEIRKKMNSNTYDFSKCRTQAPNQPFSDFEGVKFAASPSGCRIPKQNDYETKVILGSKLVMLPLVNHEDKVKIDDELFEVRMYPGFR